jgi:hypothetical protein
VSPAVLRLLGFWALWLALLGLAWLGASNVCGHLGIQGVQAALSGACLVITLIAALIAVTSRSV